MKSGIPWIAALVLCGNSMAAVISFEVSFFDSQGSSIGDGFVAIEDYTHDGSRLNSFRGTAGYEWGFSISPFSIYANSEEGDFITDGPIQSQGFYVSISDGEPARILLFFDRTGDGFIALDSSTQFSGVRFSSLSNTVDYISNGEVIETGTFSATESIGPSSSVPEPSAALLGALGGFALLRRRRAS